MLYMLIVLKVFILRSLGAVDVLSANFKGVVVIISSYEVLSNSNGYFYMLMVLKVLILVSLRYFCIDLIYFNKFYWLLV